ncbi:MAG: hypothetical protein ABUL60_08430 [Myxococcales bacterium]
MATRALTLGFAAMLAACSGDPPDEPGTGVAGANSAGAPEGGSGGARGGAESAGGAAGLRNIAGSSGGGDVAQGGLGGQANPEQIREAVYPKCEEMCYLGHEACADLAREACTANCRKQADTLVTDGRCGLEHYRAVECYVTFLKTADSVGCTTQGPVYLGCDTELTAFNECKG